jgi:hypothetical protein
MISNVGMTIENTGDGLIVRSERRGINWLGAAFATFSIVWVLKWNRHDAQSENIYWLGLVGGVIFVFIGIGLLLPRRIVTIFDLRSQRIRRTMTVFNYAYRNMTYPFSEIIGVGIIEGSQSDNRDAVPVLVFKNGAPLPLNTYRTYRPNDGDMQCNDQLKMICAVTGLRDAREHGKL